MSLDLDVDLLKGDDACETDKLVVVDGFVEGEALTSPPQSLPLGMCN